MKTQKSIFTSLSILVQLSLLAQPGSLDKTFGSGGKVNTDIGGNQDNGNAVVVQNDGKIVVAGSSTTNGNNFDCALIRYNTDGSPDNSFGSGGKVVTDFGSNFENFQSLFLQNDGKIIAVGTSIQGTKNSDVILARYNLNGTLDNTFGTGGKVISDFGPNDSNDGNAIAIQNDGKILVGGQSNSLSLIHI